MGALHQITDLFPLLHQHRLERHLIVLDEDPDPDLLASAAVYRQLAEGLSIRCEIFLPGKPGRLHQAALAGFLGLKVHWFQSGCQPARYDRLVVLGRVLDHLDRLPWRCLQALPLFLEIRSGPNPGKSGAQYWLFSSGKRLAPLFSGLFEIGPLYWKAGPDRFVELANGLVHALLVSTNKLIDAEREDLLALNNLEELIDHNLLSRLERGIRTDQSSAVFWEALGSRKNHGWFSSAGLGYQPFGSQADLERAAFQLLQESGIHTAAAYGVLRGWRSQDVLTGYVRTIHPRLDPAWLLLTAFSGDLHRVVICEHQPGLFSFRIPLGISTSRQPRDLQRLFLAYYQTAVQESFSTVLENSRFVGLNPEDPQCQPGPGCLERADLF